MYSLYIDNSNKEFFIFFSPVPGLFPFWDLFFLFPVSGSNNNINMCCRCFFYFLKQSYIPFPDLKEAFKPFPGLLFLFILWKYFSRILKSFSRSADNKTFYIFPAPSLFPLQFIFIIEKSFPDLFTRCSFSRSGSFPRSFLYGNTFPALQIVGRRFSLYYIIIILLVVIC